MAYIFSFKVFHLSLQFLDSIARVKSEMSCFSVNQAMCLMRINVPVL